MVNGTLVLSEWLLRWPDLAGGSSAVAADCMMCTNVSKVVSLLFETIGTRTRLCGMELCLTTSEFPVHDLAYVLF
jgi:hypothetical protein